MPNITITLSDDAHEVLQKTLKMRQLAQTDLTMESLVTELIMAEVRHQTGRLDARESERLYRLFRRANPQAQQQIENLLPADR